MSDNFQNYVNDTANDGSSNFVGNPSAAEFLALPSEMAHLAEMYAVVPLLNCPHLQHISQLPEEPLNTSSSCVGCDHVGENWLCLTCFSVHCSRYVKEHSLAHYNATGHPMALSYADLSVWCYCCDHYVHNPVLNVVKEAAHMAKFGVGIP